MARGLGFHMLGSVLGVFCGVIGRDGDNADPRSLHLARIADDAVDDRLNIRTMIADEHHQSAARTSHISQAIDPTIRGRQCEIMQGRAKITYRG